MVVVSQIARNNAQGVDAVAAQQTGFVQTRLQVLDLVPGTPGGPPMLVAEQTGGGPLPKPVWRSINLNRDYSQSALTEVAPGSALAQVTDVVFVEGQAVAETRLVLAAFGSDKIAILRPEPNEASGWAMTQVPIPLVDPAAGYSAVGPRGLVYDPQATEPGSGTQPGLPGPGG